MRPAILFALLAAGCTTVPLADGPLPPRSSHMEVEALVPPARAHSGITMRSEPITVEDHWLLDIYTALHPRDYRAFRVEFPGADGALSTAHLLLPGGEGPHPAVIVFPITGGDHVVSEAVAKALVNRGYAALRVERREFFPEEEQPGFDLVLPAQLLRTSLLDARTLLDWLETRPEIDSQRLASAGVSLGGILAATLMGLDERIQAGFFIMAGGGLPELLHDSREGPLRRLRERIFERNGDRSRETFIEFARGLTQPLDPLTYASRVDPQRALLISGRFDRAVPPSRTRALWQAMGYPTWHVVPVGHYQMAPFFWWCVGRGADHLDRIFGAP
jgi:cephalosporin-C deacetylase-like acetyl esterase